MKNYGFTIGWIIGMGLQLIIMTIIKLYNGNDYMNSTWWTGQLIGLLISIIVWIYLDRKEFKAILNKINWNAIQIKIVTTWYSIKNNVTNWFNS